MIHLTRRNAAALAAASGIALTGLAFVAPAAGAILPPSVGGCTVVGRTAASPGPLPYPAVTVTGTPGNDVICILGLGGKDADGDGDTNNVVDAALLLATDPAGLDDDGDLNDDGDTVDPFEADAPSAPFRVVADNGIDDASELAAAFNGLGPEPAPANNTNAAWVTWLQGQDIAPLPVLGLGGDDTIWGTPGGTGYSNGTSITVPTAATFGADVIFGGSGDDVINSLGGNDNIDGGVGDDIIRAGAGLDTIIGGAGNDSIAGEDGDDFLFGLEGDDNITGGAGADYIDGGEDDDTLDGGAGADELHGEQGDDYIAGGTGADLIFGGEGMDTINGNDGADIIFGDSEALPRLAGSTGWYDLTALVQLGSTDSFYSTPQPGTNDVVAEDYLNIDDPDFQWWVWSTDFNYWVGDEVHGGSRIIADDTIHGGRGEDFIDGEIGDDYITGDAGADTIFGGLGADSVLGNEENDVIFGDEQLWRRGLVPSELFVSIEAQPVTTLTYGFAPVYGNNAELIQAIDSAFFGDLPVDPTIDNLYIHGESDLTKPPLAQQIFAGMDGNDSLAGDDGDDYVDGGAGMNTIDGGVGMDSCRVTFSSGVFTLSTFFVNTSNCEILATVPPPGF